MTSRTDAAEARAVPKTTGDEGSMDQVTNVVYVAVATITAIGVFWNARDLTPDIVDRINSEGSSPLLTILCVITTFGMLLAGGAMLLRGRQVLASLLMFAGLLTMTWWVVCAMPWDYDGEYNPYVRLKDPLESQSQALLEAKSLPPVANMLRQAGRDGRIDRGEAHDILDSRTYSEASAAQQQRRQAEVRRELLAR